MLEKKKEKRRKIKFDQIYLKYEQVGPTDFYLNTWMQIQIYQIDSKAIKAVVVLTKIQITNE